MQLRDLVSEYQYYLISTKPREHFIKKNLKTKAVTVKKPKKKYDGHGEKLWSEEKKKKEKNEQRTLINLHEVDVRNLIFMN